MVFKERGKPEYPEKTLWQQEREPTDSPADVLRGSSRVPAPLTSVSGAVTRDEPLRTSAGEANGVDARICTGATLLGGECSHYCATLAPQTSKWIRSKSTKTWWTLFPLENLLRLEPVTSVRNTSVRKKALPMESGYIRRLTEQWNRPICRYLIMSAKCNHSTIRLAAEHCIIVVNAVLTFEH